MGQINWDDQLPEAQWQSKSDGDRFEQMRQQYRDLPTNGIRLGKSTTTNLPVYITPKQLSTHMHVIGSTGVGKSYFLEGLIKQLILAGNGVCVIDPHGDLYHRLLEYCAYLNVQKPELELTRRVIPFDIGETKQILGFNPVARNARVMTYQVVALMEAIRKCWGQATFQETPRLARWLFNAAYAVVDGGLTLLQTRHLLDTKPNEYRRAIIDRIKSPDIRAEWEWLEAVRPEKREERTESCFNRIRLFAGHEVIQPIIGQYSSTIDFHEVLGGRKIFLVNLATQNVVSKDEQHLLGTLFVNELVTAAFARPRGKREPFFCVIDEFANFVTKDMCEILDGGRKFGLHLVLAHQFLNQLKEKDPEVYFSTLTNARTKAVFGGLNDEDLEILSRELYTGELDTEEIKDEVWQTKFRPVETTRTITAQSEGESYSESEGESYGEVTHQSLAEGEVYIPGSGFWADDLSVSANQSQSSGSSSSSGRSSSRSSGHSSNTTTTEVPWYEYHEFRELSSRTFRSLEEQLYLKKAQLKKQHTQHAACLIPSASVQLIKTPTLREFKISERQREDFKAECFSHAGFFKSRADAVIELETLERNLLEEARPVIEVSSFDLGAEPVMREEVPTVKKKTKKPSSRAKKRNIFDSITDATEDSET